MVYHSLTWYRIVPLIMILLLIISIYTFFNALIEKKTKFVTKIIFTLLLESLFLFQMPTIFQGLYFYTGSVTYLSGIIFSMFYFACLIRYLKNKFLINKAIHLTILLFLLIIACGCSEVVTCIIILFHMASAFHTFIIEKNKNKLFIALSLISFLCLLVIMFSGGSIVRDSMYENNHRLLNSLWMTALQICRFLFYWISSVPLLLLSVLFVPLSLRLSKQTRLFEYKKYVHPFVFLLFIPAVLFCCIFPPYWSTGILGQHRTIDVACFFFYLLWFWNIGVWVNYFVEKRKWRMFKVNSKLSFVVLLIAIISLSLTKNGYTALNDIFSGSAKRFDVEMMQRYTILEKAGSAKVDTCFMPKIKNKPLTIYFWDADKNPKAMINEAYGIYYGINNIVCK